MKPLNYLMLVDDNSAYNEFHKIIMKEVCSPLAIKEALSAEDALDYLTKACLAGNAINYPKPDLILLDIFMPRMSGFEFMVEFDKFDPEFKEGIVIILLTSSINQSDFEKSKRIKGVNDFLHKPLTQETAVKIMKWFN